jgi:LysR family transcriptional regulator of gallate degradation
MFTSAHAFPSLGPAMPATALPDRPDRDMARPEPRARTASPAAGPSDDHWRNLRYLRAVAAVVEQGTVIKAADALCLSQPAVTRSIHALEAALGHAMFDRCVRGMVPTCAGKIIAWRAGRAFDHLKQAAGGARDEQILRVLTYRQLVAFRHLAECGTETRAASQMGISQPGLHRIVRELETAADLPLVHRSAQGVTLTPAGDTFLRGVRLAMEELRLAGEELAAQLGRPRQQLVLGTLPLTNALLVSSAIERVLQAYPHMQITVIDGPYETLLRRLRGAEIDALVGALRDGPDCRDLRQEHLFDDTLAVAVRADHPLTRHAHLALEALVDQEWVAPVPDTPSHEAFQRAFATVGAAPPGRCVHANSMNLIRALLLGSDRLALVSGRSMAQVRQIGMLAFLPVALRQTERPIGILQRAHQPAFPALQIFMQALRELARG